MEYNTKFISDLRQFNEALFSAVESSSCSEIFISGTWNKAVYEEILSKIIKDNSCHKCKIIIPHMSSNGSMPKVLINKIVRLKGQVRISSRLGGNLLIIGTSAFVVSFSYRESREGGPKAFFECCMMTDHENTVEDIKDRFMHTWESSLPIISEVS